MHYHKLKDETFYIQKGRISVKTIDKYNNISEFEMKEGDVLEIPKGLKHQFKGIDKKTEIFEISTQHFDNDSIQIKEENYNEQDTKRNKKD